MENFLFTINVVAPVFLLVALGYFLKKIDVVDTKFVVITSKFVFNVSLPALVFIKISTIPVQDVLRVGEIIFVCVGILVIYGISWVVAYRVSDKGEDRGVFIQGSYRSNFAIVGLAIISNMYNSDAVGHASLLLAFAMILFNIFAVIALTIPLQKEESFDTGKTLAEIIKNPLILAIIIAVPFSYWQIEIDETLFKTGNYLAVVALPLALIGIGSTLSPANIFIATGKAHLASLLKIVVFPLLTTTAAILVGYRGETLAILFILFGTPTAIVSFIMANAMGGNTKLAGNIVAITTMGSVFTIALGLFILKINNFI